MTPNHAHDPLVLALLPTWNQLQDELHTHLAATARRSGSPYDGMADTPRPLAGNGGVPGGSRTAGQVRHAPNGCGPAGQHAQGFDSGIPAHDLDFDVDYGFLEDATWYPDEPDWIATDMSWAQRHLLDVYMVYGALIMAVGLLMKLTWNLVW